MEWLSDNQSLQLFAELVHERTGLLFDSYRMEILAEKISPLVTQGKFDSVLDYYFFLRYDENADAEWKRLQAVLAVNETYFLREMKQIQAAASSVIPNLQQERNGQVVRIWHAACATGEEPYTMAMVLDQMGCYRRGPIEILATDFNLHAIDRAKAGVFRARSFRDFPDSMKEQYFLPAGPGNWKICDAIQERVKFSYLNLLDKAAMNQMPGYDLIFCRNVFIYFSTPAIEQVIKCFHRSLNTRGYLFVAAAESLLRWSDLYELTEIGDALAYQKIDQLNGHR